MTRIKIWTLTFIKDTYGDDKLKHHCSTGGTDSDVASFRNFFFIIIEIKYIKHLWLRAIEFDRLDQVNNFKNSKTVLTLMGYTAQLTGISWP